MLRKALFVIALAGLACGSQETTPSTSDTGATGDASNIEAESATPPVSAVQPSAAEAAAPSAEALSCLELVSDEKYAEAVPVCQTAANQDPSNTDVAAALANAISANAAAAATGAASDAAAAASAAAGQAVDSAAASAKDALAVPSEKATE